MKHLIKISLHKAALVSLLVAGPALMNAAQAQDVAKIGVNGMVCAFCAQGIEKTLSKLPEAQAVYVNLDQRIVAVEAKKGQKLSLDKIKAGIVDAGYDVTKTEMLSGTSVAAIRSEMKTKK